MKKYFRILLALSLLLVPIIGIARNVLNYAYEPNGDMPVKLFPSENGITQFRLTQPIQDDETSLDNAENVINNWSIRPNCKIKPINIGRKSMSYAIQLSCGSEMLFFFERPASVLKFNCCISATKGEYTVQLTNFETNRNNIRGEAKNDGDPNYIHWQRVNSLLKEYCTAVKEYNPSSRKHQRIAYDYNNRIAYECGLYVQEWNSLNQFINDIVNANNALHTKSPEPTAFDFNIYELKNNLPFGDFKNRFVERDNIIHSKDTCENKLKICVFGGTSTYEKAGQSEIIKNLIIDTDFRIVDNAKDADYSIEYVVNTSGRDKAIVSIIDKDGKRLLQKRKSASENISDNREVAESLYFSCISNFFKQL